MYSVLQKKEQHNHEAAEDLHKIYPGTLRHGQCRRDVAVGVFGVGRHAEKRRSRCDNEVGCVGPESGLLVDRYCSTDAYKGDLVKAAHLKRSIHVADVKVQFLASGKLRKGFFLLGSVVTGERSMVTLSLHLRYRASVERRGTVVRDHGGWGDDTMQTMRRTTSLKAHSPRRGETRARLEIPE